MDKLTIKINRHSTKFIAKDFTSDRKGKVVYYTHKATHYSTARDIVVNHLAKYYSQFNLRVVIRDSVVNEVIIHKPDKSVPPEDKYKGLPVCNRYIPDKLVTFEANGMRYRVDKDFNLYTEDNSGHYRNIKKSRLRYLTSQYDNDRMSADTFVYDLNKAIDNR